MFPKYHIRTHHASNWQVTELPKVQKKNFLQKSEIRKTPKLIKKDRYRNGKKFMKPNNKLKKQTPEPSITLGQKSEENVDGTQKGHKTSKPHPKLSSK